LDLVQALSHEELNPQQLNVIMKQAWHRERELVETVVKRSRSNPGQIRGSLYFRHYWQQQNKRLGL